MENSFIKLAAAVPKRTRITGETHAGLRLSKLGQKKKKKKKKKMAFKS